MRPKLASKRKGKPSEEELTETSPKRLLSSNFNNSQPQIYLEQKKLGCKKYESPKSSLLKCTCEVRMFSTFFREKLKPLMRYEHWELLSTTPFCHFFVLPEKWVVANAVLHLLLESWDPESQVFFYKGVELSFDAREVGMMLGLKLQGLAVSEGDVKGRGESRINSKYFNNKNLIQRKEIEERLLDLVSSSDEEDPPPSDFVKVLILYLFAMVFFPLTKNQVDGYLVHYVDALDLLNEYSWAGAIYSMLEPQVTKLSNWVNGLSDGQTYFKGCSLALLAWFYEHMDVSQIRAGFDIVPRMYNWKLTGQPHRTGGFKKMLDTHPKTKVKAAPLVPTDDEVAILKNGFFDSKITQMIRSQKEVLLVEPLRALPLDAAPPLVRSIEIANRSMQEMDSTGDR